MDGTIIDTELMWAQATAQMLAVRNKQYDNEIQKLIHDKVHGLPPLKACAMVKEMFDLSESVELLAQEKAYRATQLFKGNTVDRRV